MQDQISVIIPCYNDGKYIEETIHKLKEQTFAAHEIIVVNDGSTDEYTLKVLADLDKASLVKVLHKENGRMSAARNYGVHHATGNIIVTLDADDYFDNRFFQKGIDSIFDLFLFLKKNFLILTTLLISGIALGFYLDIKNKSYDHEVIVIPNFGSTDYLYSKVDLLASKKKENDTSFLHSLGIKNIKNLGTIKIEPITKDFQKCPGIAQDQKYQNQNPL